MKPPGIGYKPDIGEPTIKEKRRRYGMILGLLAFTITLAAAGAYFLGDTYNAANGSLCRAGADYHMRQAEADPANATAHYNAADTYMRAEAYGHTCQWEDHDGMP